MCAAMLFSKAIIQAELEVNAPLGEAMQIQGAFRFAHFRAAKGFVGNRAPAQRPSQSHQCDTAVGVHEQARLGLAGSG